MRWLLIRVLSPLMDPAVRACIRAITRDNARLRHERDMHKHQAARLARAGRELAAHNTAVQIDNRKARDRLLDLEPTVVIQLPNLTETPNGF